MSAAAPASQFYGLIVARIKTVRPNVELGRRPGPTNSPTAPPYAIVYPLDSPATEGPLCDSQESREYEWQVSSVAADPAQALRWAEDVHNVLRGWTPVLAGWSFQRIRTEGIGRCYPDQDQTAQVQLYIAPVRFSMWVQPA